MVEGELVIPLVRQLSRPIYEPGDTVRLRSPHRGSDMTVVDHRTSDDCVICEWTYEGIPQRAGFDAAILEVVRNAH